MEACREKLSTQQITSRRCAYRAAVLAVPVVVILTEMANRARTSTSSSGTVRISCQSQRTSIAQIGMNRAAAREQKQQEQRDALHAEAVWLWWQHLDEFSYGEKLD